MGAEPSKPAQKLCLEPGVVELQKTLSASPQCVGLHKDTCPKAIYVSLNENHGMTFEPAKLWYITRADYIDSNAIYLNLQSFDEIKNKKNDLLFVTPYAEDGGAAESMICLVDFSYEIENKNYMKKNYHLDTDILANTVRSYYNYNNREAIYAKSTINHVRIGDYIGSSLNKICDPTAPQLKICLVIILDSDKNHLKRATMSKDTKILFRCANRRICMTGSHIDKSRKVAKLCTKEEFMEIKNEIGGLDHVVDQLYNSLILSRINMEKANELGLKVNIGAIFVGPPGTGKSALASLVSKKLDGKFTFVKGPELKAGVVGATERQIRDLFDTARKDYEEYGLSAPYHIVVIDEIDALTPQRNTSSATHDNSMTNQFLACTSTDMPPNLLIFGTTNMVHLVDAAVTREGRLGLCIDFNLPDDNQRAAILNIYLNTIDKYVQKDMPLDELIKLSRGFVGADIEAAVNEVKHMLLEDPLLKTIGLDTFVQVFSRRRLAKQFCNYILWHNDIEVCLSYRKKLDVFIDF